MSLASQLESLDIKVAPVIEDLERYLLVHECEIAIDENDFGSLFRVFKVLIGRDPEK